MKTPTEILEALTVVGVKAHVVENPHPDDHPNAVRFSVYSIAAIPGTYGHPAVTVEVRPSGVTVTGWGPKLASAKAALA